MKLLPYLFIAITLTIYLNACNTTISNEDSSNQETTQSRSRAKFEPADGEVILFVGQELEALGGVDDYNDGYLDHFETPGGFTMYTNLTPGAESYGHIAKGMDGVLTTDDWGDSPSNMSMQLADPDFENMALAIGLSLVGQEDKVASGENDSILIAFGKWINSLGDRPVFLRIGYEFDGHSWNHYDRDNYIAAFRHIRDSYDSMGIENVAYVWQSTGWVSNQEHLEAWYPGDDYVDWCGTSFFNRWKEIEMTEFAKLKGKPMFIAEASPTISTETTKFDGQTKETILSNPDQAEEAWLKWFQPLFNLIDENPNTIKAVSYINCNWKSHEMWFENPAFQYTDARIHTSPLVSERWIAETSKAKYLKATPGLIGKLWEIK